MFISLVSLLFSSHQSISLTLPLPRLYTHTPRNQLRPRILSTCLAGVSHYHSMTNNNSQLTPALDDASQAHQDVYGQDGPQPDNQASFSHEVIAGAAGFEAMRKYQQHEQANGTLSHTALLPPLLLPASVSHTSTQSQHC